ncbi:hypothetical protein LOK49_LG02G03138 [Camellia lanceoleosa]|uniref:Uncharacterized protein n=1 Tax=Camellia lanceoleosa TaxID=1840588 RepID=A0ACC0IJX6_9ERIC|nr:hypothetical protein LOK49_LG02G03138 [Camellia lanceoleosa]
MITFLFFLVLLFFYANATPLSFNLPTIQHNDSLINCTGDAYISSQGIQVTRDPDVYDMPSLQWRTGRATCTQPMHLWDTATGNLTDFSTNFSFIIRGNNYGEGLAFFLVPNGSNIPPNSTGGGLGLINENQTTTSTGVNRFVAVEFDTYKNNPWQEGLPINHVSINVNSRRSSVDPIYWLSGISNGRTNEARIKYNSSTQNLSVSFFGFENDAEFTQGLFLIVDLRRHLPEWVTFGFSASTGDSYEKNTIRSWEFTASFPSDERVEEAAKGKNKIGLVVGLSAGLGVVVGGIALVWFVLCRKVKVLEDHCSCNKTIDKAIDHSSTNLDDHNSVNQYGEYQAKADCCSKIGGGRKSSDEEVRVMDDIAAEVASTAEVAAGSEATPGGERRVGKSNASWVSETMVNSSKKNIVKPNEGSCSAVDDSSLMKLPRKINDGSRMVSDREPSLTPGFIKSLSGSEGNKPSINIEVVLEGAQVDGHADGLGSAFKNKDVAQTQNGLAQSREQPLCLSQVQEKGKINTITVGREPVVAVTTHRHQEGKSANLNQGSQISIVGSQWLVQAQLLCVARYDSRLSAAGMLLADLYASMLLLLSCLSIITFYILLATPCATALNFNIAKIDHKNLNVDITTNGDTYISSNGIHLAADKYDTNLNYKVGKATYVKPLHLYDSYSGKLNDFTTYFSFVIDSDGSSTFGDGLAFFLEPSDSSSTTDTTTGGTSGLPIDPSALEATSPFVAVEFDTF